MVENLSGQGRQKKKRGNMAIIYSNRKSDANF